MFSRISFALAIVLISLGVGLGSFHRSSAQGTPETTSGKIAFESRQGQKTANIFVMDLKDGVSGTPTNLTNNNDNNFLPNWSPDGKQVVFERYTVDPAAPNAFDAIRMQIYVMNADGSNQVNVSNDPAGGYYYPSWSADGKQIVYTHMDDNGQGNTKGNIYVMNADGSNRVRLTDQGTSNSWPQWSPDGKSILFDSDRDVPGGVELYLMATDGSNVRRLNSTPAGWDVSDRASWSPDGSHIVFSAINLDRPPAPRRGAIYVLDLSTGTVQQLTDPTWFGDFPHYSPDGKRIVFQAGLYEQSSVYVINADGSQPIKVADQAEGPNWVR